MFPQEIIETIMQSRGIDNIENFLNPTLNEYMMPFEDLKNIILAPGITQKIKRTEVWKKC